jgi:phage head maturation protease
MSFGFNVTDEAWPSATMRELREVELVEISVVQAFPAYSATSVIARSRSAASASMRLRRRFLETL